MEAIYLLLYYSKQYITPAQQYWSLFYVYQYVKFSSYTCEQNSIEWFGILNITSLWNIVRRTYNNK